MNRNKTLVLGILIFATFVAAKSPPPPGVIPPPAPPEVYETVEATESAEAQAESDSADQELAREIEIREIAPTEVPPENPEPVAQKQQQRQQEAPAPPFDASDAQFDPVQKNQVESIAGRLGLVQKLLLKHHRAYDYRLLTKAELETILKDLDREQKPKKKLSRK